MSIHVTQITAKKIFGNKKATAYTWKSQKVNPLQVVGNGII